MMEKCFDEGIIQAFFDGELDHNSLEQVARHVSLCDGCAMMMSDVEAESATLAAAFEIENFELVPTERLRTKIFSEIAELENGRTSWFKKATAALGFSGGLKWHSSQVAAFASLVLVVGVVAYVISSKPGAVVQGPLVAVNTPSVPSKSVPQVEQAPSVVADPGTEDVAVEGPRVVRASYSEPRYTPVKAVYTPRPLDDERQYLQAIDTLEKSVDDRNDSSTLKPSKQVSYQRDMAVVDDAIKKMQKVVRKNPKDDASKQLLIASYQNKIDLLNAVSEKAELMASLR